MPQGSPLPSLHLHILVFAPESSWRSWLANEVGPHPYVLFIEEVSTPRAVLLQIIQRLPHLLLLDLNSSSDDLQQILGFIERTCPFVPQVGLASDLGPSLGEWQRELLPAYVSREKPEEVVSCLDWAFGLKTDDAHQARKMRIMQQIDKNLKALEEMEGFFDEGSRLPNSFSQQTRKEISSSRKYLEALRNQLRKKN